MVQFSLVNKSAFSASYCGGRVALYITLVCSNSIIRLCIYSRDKIKRRVQPVGFLSTVADVAWNSALGRVRGVSRILEREKWNDISKQCVCIIETEAFDQRLNRFKNTPYHDTLKRIMTRMTILKFDVSKRIDGYV